MNVASRDRNAGIEDGRYSAVGGSGGAGVDDWPENLNGIAFLVRVAARVRIAVRCGVLLEVPVLIGATLELRKVASDGEIQKYDG